MRDLKAIVAGMYEAFRRGDVPAILAKLAPDVRWEHWPDNSAQKAGVPWLQPRTGRDEVRGFYDILATYQFHEVRVASLLGGENKVVAEVIVEATLSNGVRIRDEQLHLFTFNDAGQVVAFREYIDTAKVIAATRG
jgi:ketosteroid isomerase-like protein